MLIVHQVVIYHNDAKIYQARITKDLRTIERSSHLTSQLLNTYEHVSFSVKHDKSRNDGNEFQKGINSGSKTVKTPLTSITHF